MTTKPSYTSLVVWQRADDLFVRLHRLASKSFPVEDRIAWGSLQEVGYLIHVAKRLEYISEGSADDLTKEVRQVAAPLSGLISSFDGRARPYKPRKPSDV